MVLNYQHWVATAVGETSGGFSGFVCMTALNVVQDVQFGNVCLCPVLRMQQLGHGCVPSILTGIL